VILCQHRREQAAWRLRLGLGALNGDQPVFPSMRRGGGWLRPNAVSTRFKTLTRKVNTARCEAGLEELPEIRHHDVRHPSRRPRSTPAPTSAASPPGSAMLTRR
jgi:hypothetical protein